METYCSTFITGFSSVIKDALREKLKELDISLVLDGLIVYQTNYPIEKVKNLRFINNSYILIKAFQKNNPDIKQLINKLSACNELKDFLNKHEFPKKSTFRIIISRENQIISVDSQIIKPLERTITRNSPLRSTRSDPGCEFWLLTHIEGFSFFGLRITPTVKKHLAKGQLRPEIAHILCLISEPDENDIFLDPFCGSGAIPIERTYFPHKRILAGDIDPKYAKQLRQKIKKHAHKLTIGRWDALQLKTFKDKSVDKIVTDPPWGLYRAKNLNFNRFYNNMLNEFNRILKPNRGITVVLTAQKRVFKKCLDEHRNNLRLIEKYNTLVSGKKACVYKLLKI